MIKENFKLSALIFLCAAVLAFALSRQEKAPDIIRKPASPVAVKPAANPSTHQTIVGVNDEDLKMIILLNKFSQ